MNNIQRTVQGFPVRTTGQPTHVPRRVLGIQALAQWKGENREAADFWLRQEIGGAFQQLVCLGLPGQPAAEMLPCTAEMWLLTIGPNMIQEIDRERIRKGFGLLYRKLKQWPLPVELLDILPPRPERMKITENRTVSDEEHAEQSRRLAELMEMFEKGEFGGSTE